MKLGISRLFLLTAACVGLLDSSPRDVAAIDLSHLPAALPRPGAGTPRPSGALHAGATGASTSLPRAKKPSGVLPTRTTADRLAEMESGVDRYVALQRTGLGTRIDARHLTSAEAVYRMADLVEANSGRLEAVWQDDGTLRSLTGVNLLPNAVPPSTSPTGVARAFLTQYAAVLGVENPDAELVPFRVEDSVQGFRAVRFQQEWRGVPIWGHDVIVRLDPAGHVIGFGGHYAVAPKFASTTPALPVADAQQRVLSALGARDGRAVTPLGTSLMFFPWQGALHLAWRVEITGGLDYRREVFVDARTGEVLHDVSLVMQEDVLAHSPDLSNTTREVHAFKINSDFFLINTKKSMFDASGTLPNDGKGIIWLINAQNGDGSQLIHVTTQNKENWGAGNRNAISAAFWANIVFDYYKVHHNRNSIDNNGMNLQLVTNFKTNYNNAFWNGTFMIFGNGDGNTFSDLAGSLDVTGHEMSHGVTEHSANLVYELQSGALNEHFSDAMGVAVDFFANPGTANFLVGEDVTSPAIPGDGLRNMQDPHNAFDNQPATMAEYNDLPNDDEHDHGGVHTNSGIPNRAFFLAATAAGMTVAKADLIWYRCLTQYLVRNSQFVDFRIGLTKAAEDLHGAGSSEQNAVVAALNAVGIPGAGGGGGTPPPPPLPDNSGTDFIAVHDTVTGQLFRVTPDFSTATQISDFEMGLGGRPSFTDDGTAFAWVDFEGNIHAARSDGTNAAALSTQGGWWSVAVNADGSKLAATTTAEDGTIFVFDLVHGGSGTPFNLTTQNSSGGSQPDNVVYADVVEFAATANVIMYDALNRATLTGDTIEYWDINLLNIDNGSTLRVFQSLPRGESVGDPTFAQNSDNKMAFDYFPGDGTDTVVGFDFNSGQSGIIAGPLPDVGRPTFSGDDHQVYFQSDDAGHVGFFNLAADGITGTGTLQPWASEATNPVWFTVGNRPTPVTLVSFTGAWQNDAVRLDWRVADAAGTVGYHVERQLAEGTGFERRTAEIIPAAAGADGAYRFDEAAPLAAAATYRVLAVERNGAVRELGRLAVDRQGGGVAELRPVLLPASPNPFVGSTQVRFVIPASLAGSPGSVTVHDLSGRLVAHLLDNAPLEAGERTLAWDGTGAGGARVAAGAYFVRLTAGRTALTQKVIVAR